MLKRIFIIMLFLVMVGCQNPNLQETPSETINELYAALTGDLGTTIEPYYEDYVNLFNEYAKENATKEKFQGLRNVIGSSTGGSQSTFSMMTFNNGSIMLVQLDLNSKTDKYEIYNIYVVPEEMRYYFEDILN